jgi:hypothetical protein
MKKTYGIGWYTTRGSQHPSEHEENKPPKTARQQIGGGETTPDTIVGF